MVIIMEEEITNNSINDTSIDFEYKRGLHWSEWVKMCVFMTFFLVKMNLLFFKCQCLICSPGFNMLWLMMVLVFLSMIRWLRWFPSHYNNSGLVMYTLLTWFVFSSGKCAEFVTSWVFGWRSVISRPNATRWGIGKPVARDLAIAVWGFFWWIEMLNWCLYSWKFLTKPALILASANY